MTSAAPRGRELAVTVFTPTYDRAATLRRPYESLVAQSCRNFEWLVVDDGSTDNTEELVMGWAREADFPIRYVYQRNSSKAAAWNRALGLASGDVIVALDSDDGITAHALARCAEEWRRLRAAGHDRFAAMFAAASDECGRPMNPPLPRDPLDADFFQIRYRYDLWFEMFESYDLAAVRRFPLPLIPGYTGYMPEGILVDRLSRAGLKTRFIGEQLRVYYRGNEEGTEHYAVGQTWRTGVRHAPGLSLAYGERLAMDCGWARTAPGYFMRIAGHYSRFALHCGTSLRAQFAALRRPLPRALWAAMLPVGIALYARDLLFGSRAARAAARS